MSRLFNKTSITAIAIPLIFLLSLGATALSPATASANAPLASRPLVGFTSPPPVNITASPPVYNETLPPASSFVSPPPLPNSFAPIIGSTGSDNSSNDGTSVTLTVTTTLTIAGAPAGASPTLVYGASGAALLFIVAMGFFAIRSRKPTSIVQARYLRDHDAASS